jgi:hypothetical protein
MLVININKLEVSHGGEDIAVGLLGCNLQADTSFLRNILSI